MPETKSTSMYTSTVRALSTGAFVAFALSSLGTAQQGPISAGTLKSDVAMQGTFQGGTGCNVLLDQTARLSYGYFADVGCDLCGGTPQILADSFALAVDQELCDITIWGAFFAGNVNPGGSFDLFIHEDAGGIPGAVVYSESGIAYSGTPTGGSIGSADEVEFTIVPASPVLLTGGATYWIEIYSYTGLGTDDWLWVAATPDPVNGAMGLAFALEHPSAVWNTFADDDLAMLVRGQDPAPSCPDDALEENDDCGSELALTNGMYMGLTASHTDWDYYSFDVANGDTLFVDIFFTDADADMDLFLYAQALCKPFALGNTGCTDTLDCGFSVSDNESVSWTNNTGVTQTIIAKVNLWVNTAADCGDYDMAVAGVIEPLGT
ncbi:MAG: hypothetical protein ACI82F_002989, partial [Planctomycetota bacterium]